MREWLISSGIWGVAALMFLQNIVPVLPSEVIMPLAGFLASRGLMPIHLVILVGMGGSLLGHLPWYFLGMALGEKRFENFADKHGRWIRLRRRHVEKAESWFNRNEAKAVFLGRLVPALRTYVNIPAGATRMAIVPFLFFTILGEAVWDTGLALGGYFLGRDYKLIGHYLHFALIPVALAGVAFWLYKRRHRRRRHRHA